MGTPKVITQAQQYTCKLPRRGSPPLTFHSFIMKAFAVVLVLCLAGLAAALQPTTYCINLEQHADRRHHMEEVFSAANLANVNWEGVDGSSLSEEELNKYFLTEGTRAKLLPAELGAALSHISIWRKVAASSAPLSLVFEDDVVIPATFLHNLESTVSELPENWDIMYLSYLKAWEFKRPEKYSDHLVQPNWPLGFYAYAITPAGAQRLPTLLKLALKFLKTVLTVVLMPLLPAGSMTARPPPSLPPLNCATTALLSRLSLATETTAFLVILCKLALLPLLPLHLQPHPPTLLPPTLHPPAPPAHHPQAHFHQLKSALPQLSSPPFLPSLLLLPLLCKSF